MIEVSLIGRFGNNIFQYSLAKIISKHNQYSIKVTNNKYGNIFQDQHGVSHHSPVEILSGHKIELTKVLENTNNRKIKLQGFFHRYEYYIDYKNEILSWLNLPKYSFDTSPTKEDIVIHVRQGDLHPSYPITPFGYFKNIIENSTFDKLYIVTENKNNPIVQKIQKQYNAIIITNNEPIKDFLFLLNSYKIILSMSSFCWWAAFLSQATEIHAPLIGVWHPRGMYKNQVNYMVSESRYHYYDLGPYDNYNGSEKQINELLQDQWNPQNE